MSIWYIDYFYLKKSEGNLFTIKRFQSKPYFNTKYDSEDALARTF